MRKGIYILSVTLLLLSLMGLASISPHALSASDSWQEVGVPGNGVTALCFRESDNHMYAGSGNGHVYRYDGGRAWTDVGNPGDDMLLINTLVYNPADGKLYAGGESSLVARYDGGTTWTNLYNPDGTIVSSLGFNGADSKVYSGHGFGQTWRYDGGTSWTGTGAPGGGMVQDMAWAPSQSRLYAAGGSLGIVAWYAGGTTWVNTVPSEGGPNYPGSTRTLLYNNADGLLYAGSLNHIYSFDGANWVDRGAAAPTASSVAYDGLAFDTRKSKVFAGYDNGHVYRGDGSAWTDIGNPGSASYVGRLAYGKTDGGVYAGMSDGHVYAYLPGPNPPVPPPDRWKSTFYFAEGYTGAGFQEYATFGNPNTSPAAAWITCMFPDGSTFSQYYAIAPTSRLTVDINDLAAAGREVSMRIVSTSSGVVAERPMYFNYAGKWTGGSDAIGSSGPSRAWYFAEGNTLPEFDQYVTVLNPGATPADLSFHYMIEGEGEKVVGARVDPTTRATFKTVDQVGSNKNLSLYLEASQDVVAERPMYFDYRGLAANDWTGGHDVVGANAPRTDWYFAEGTTRRNSVDGAFETWLCLQNPQDSAIKVNALYQFAPGQGANLTKTYMVQPKQRLTLSVNAEVGEEKDCSLHLTSSTPFLAERPMYFNYHGKWTGGHDVLGAGSSVSEWFFAEGTTRSGFDEWLCLQNTGSKDAHVEITYYTGTGQGIAKKWTVNATARLTVSANSDVGPGQDVSARLSSDVPIIVERPMYFDFRGWNGGHDVLGLPVSASD